MNTIEAFGESKSILAWSKDDRCLVSRKGLVRRLDSGMSPEVALSTPPSTAGSKSGASGLHIKAFGEAKSVNAWASDPRCKVSRSMLRKRLSSGMPPEEALSGAPTKNPDKTLRFAFGRFKTLAAHHRDSNCPISYVQLIARISAGMDLETALSEPAPSGRLIEAFGESKTFSAWAEDDRCVVSPSLFRYRVGAGWSHDDAASSKSTVSMYTAFGEEKSLLGWLDDVRCIVGNPGTLHSRIHETGMSVEDALITPVNTSDSYAERTLADFVKSLGFEIERNTRKVIQPQELDIYIPAKNFAIEYNGLYWHSEGFKTKTYHADKLKACSAAGIRLIQIWEDDWRDRRPVVESMLRHKLGVSRAGSVFARNTTVDLDLNVQTCRDFLDTYHLQGFVGSSVQVGLRSEGTLVALGCFSKSQDEDWNLVRYATSSNVVGGFSKVLKNFRRVHSGSIKTFADLCCSDGNLYESLGFKHTSQLNPDYSYLVNDSRVHKFLYRKERFRSDPLLKFAPQLTERQLAELNGLARVWDAGKIKYVLPSST